MATDGAGDAPEINMAARHQAGGHQSIFATDGSKSNDPLPFNCLRNCFDDLVSDLGGIG